MILRELHSGTIVNELKRQASITELERAMAERVSSCSFIHLLICFTALRCVKLDELHCQVAMLQADLEAQKAVEPVSSSREVKRNVSTSKNIQKSIKCNQMQSIYLSSLALLHVLGQLR